jgi:hypothetical protein
VCTIDDPRATELSGLVATPEGYVAINDSQLNASATRVFHLDATCAVVRMVGYPTPARDPEDLTVAPDGTLWVADTGDNLTNEPRRPTVALWQVSAQGAPVIHRLTYPDGPHDAEALLFTGAGVPVLITKELDGSAGLYEPEEALRPRTAEGVPLTRVGTFKPTGPATTSVLGVMITGAGVSPDRSKVVLRTYAEAYEWDVTDGDVVRAITSGVPRVTPLPDEPQGEAIAYTADGTAFLTLSDVAGPTTIRKYVPGTQTVAPHASPSPPPGLPQPEESDDPSGVIAWLDSVPLGYSLGAALLGVIVAGVGLLGVVRGRRRRAQIGEERPA